MYDGVANTDSEVVFLELALDHGRRSLANGSASLGSTPFASTRLVMKPGSGIARLLHHSESRRTRSSSSRSPYAHSFTDTPDLEVG
jgi:hypothetical protein